MLRLIASFDQNIGNIAKNWRIAKVHITEAHGYSEERDIYRKHHIYTHSHTHAVPPTATLCHLESDASLQFAIHRSHPLHFTSVLQHTSIDRDPACLTLPLPTQVISICRKYHHRAVCRNAAHTRQPYEVPRATFCSKVQFESHHRLV